MPWFFAIFSCLCVYGLLCIAGTVGQPPEED